MSETEATGPPRAYMPPSWHDPFLSEWAAILELPLAQVGSAISSGALQTIVRFLTPFTLLISATDRTAPSVVPVLSRSNRSRERIFRSMSSRSERSSEMIFVTSMSLRFPPCSPEPLVQLRRHGCETKSPTAKSRKSTVGRSLSVPQIWTQRHGTPSAFY